MNEKIPYETCEIFKLYPDGICFYHIISHIISSQTCYGAAQPVLSRPYSVTVKNKIYNKIK